MQIRIERLRASSDGTLGSLSVDGVWECFTKEPSLRSDRAFIAGESCLPAGWYNVSLTPSRRYGRIVPLLASSPVSLHGGVRISLGMRLLPGQHVLDSDSGILLGQEQGPKSVSRTRLAYEALFVKLEAARARSEAIDAQIVNP